MEGQGQGGGQGQGFGQFPGQAAGRSQIKEHSGQGRNDQVQQGFFRDQAQAPLAEAHGEGRHRRPW